MVLLLILLLSLPSEALEIKSIQVRERDSALIFGVKLADFNENMVESVQLYYSFESGDPKDPSWSSKIMGYNETDREWAVEIEKMGDSGVIHYYVAVRYNGSWYTSYVREYRYYSTDNAGNLQIYCLIAFFVFFVIFELVMRYPLLKKRKKAEKETEEKNEEKNGKDGGITKCPYCGRIIPEKSDKCPYCASVLNTEQSKEITMGDD